MRFFGKIRIRIFDPRSLGSWCIKGTDESLPRVDSAGPLIHHDPSGLGSKSGCSLDFDLQCLSRDWALVYNDAILERIKDDIAKRSSFRVKSQRLGDVCPTKTMGRSRNKCKVQ